MARKAWGACLENRWEHSERRWPGSRRGGGRRSARRGRSRRCAGPRRSERQGPRRSGRGRSSHRHGRRGGGGWISRAGGRRGHGAVASRGRRAGRIGRRRAGIRGGRVRIGGGRARIGAGRARIGVAAPGSGVGAVGSGIAAPGSGVVAAGAPSVAAGSWLVPPRLAVGRSFRLRREPAACRWAVRSGTAAGLLSVVGPRELAGLGTVGSEPVPLGGGTETVEAAPVVGMSAVLGGSLTLVAPGTLVGAGELLSEVEAVPRSADPLGASLTTTLEVFAVSGTAGTVASAGAGTLSFAAAAVVAQIHPSTRAGSTARPARATTCQTADGAVPAERGVARLRLALPAGKELRSLTRRDRQVGQTFAVTIAQHKTKGPILAFRPGSPSPPIRLV